MDRAPLWYPRFEAVPSLGYHSPPGLLPPSPADALAEPHAVAVGDGRQHMLMWSNAAGAITMSPAQAWKTAPQPGDSDARQALRQLYQALTLPGTLNDYHYLLQGCCDALWRARLDEPELLGDLERLCLLDLRLLETHAAGIASIAPAGPFLHVMTCNYLITLYEREGSLREALAIAERGQRLNPASMVSAVERLRSRVARLAMEAAEAAEPPENAAAADASAYRVSSQGSAQDGSARSRGEGA